MTSCQRIIEHEYVDRDYYDMAADDTIGIPSFFAVTDEESLQYGERVAYVDNSGDTTIPFGKFAYYGTDTLIHYANVIENLNDSTFGRQVGIDKIKKYSLTW
jgi:hypothetical protein